MVHDVSATQRRCAKAALGRARHKLSLFVHQLPEHGSGEERPDGLCWLCLLDSERGGSELLEELQHAPLSQRLELELRNSLGRRWVPRAVCPADGVALTEDALPGLQKLRESLEGGQTSFNESTLRRLGVQRSWDCYVEGAKLELLREGRRGLLPAGH